MKTGVFNLGITFLVLFNLSACNKDQFYEKNFLETPTDVPNDGATTGSGDQGGIDFGGDTTQGGVDSGETSGGVDGSTSGGTSGGETSGGVDGSTSGGTSGGETTGGVDGSTAGGTSGGETSGGVDGSTAGGTSGGETSGGVDGSTAGGATTGGTTYGDCNNGHGNDPDHLDESNPTIGLEARCTFEKFTQTSESSKKLDILWVIDNSGSMNDEQDALGSNFSAFIDEFIQKNVDFKMAITTTDTSRPYLKGAVVPGSESKLNAVMAQSNPQKFMDDFRNLVNVGTHGSGKEKGLEATQGFMEKYASTFLRPDAYLAVVLISDEEDQSPLSVSSYMDYLKSFKSTAGLIKMYSIVDVFNSNCCDYGVTTGSQRYKDASSQTSGIVSDIRGDFYKSLSGMGDSLIKLLDSFALGHTPQPGTLKVYVNDSLVTNFTYDSISRSIKFAQNDLPPVGATIKVYYVK